MVFYDPLPQNCGSSSTKWSIQSFLSAVNKQIKTLNREIELLNNIEADKSVRGYEYEDFPRAWAHCCPQVTGWTIKEWNSFRRSIPPSIFVPTVVLTSTTQTGVRSLDRTLMDMDGIPRCGEMW